MSSIASFVFLGSMLSFACDAAIVIIIINNNIFIFIVIIIIIIIIIIIKPDVLVTGGV